MCREAVASGDARWAEGLSSSIAFLLAALFLTGGTFAFALWRRLRA
jgi:hypothetical protein